MTDDAVLAPLYLTRETALYAAEEVVNTILRRPMARFIDHPTGHIVVMVPLYRRGGAAAEPIPVPPPFLEYTFGERGRWTHPFDDFARSKALQIWHGRAQGDRETAAHLLYSGDTPYWGGVAREGIVVACSGLPPYFDRMASGMIADMCIGLARHERAADDRKDGDGGFLA